MPINDGSNEPELRLLALSDTCLVVLSRSHMPLWSLKKSKAGEFGLNVSWNDVLSWAETMATTSITTSWRIMSTLGFTIRWEDEALRGGERCGTGSDIMIRV